MAARRRPTNGSWTTRCAAWSTPPAPTPPQSLPDIVAAHMTGDRLTVFLHDPHPAAPPPWHADDSGREWSVSTGDELPVTASTAADYLAPYPTLVGIGYHTRHTTDLDGDLPTAGKWLLDLERAGQITLTGDRSRCLDLARFIAAALAVNAWSDHVTVTMAGFGAELVGLNPERLRHTDNLDDAATLLRADLDDAATAQAHAGVDVLSARAA